MEPKDIDLSKLPEENILNLRVCELPISIEGSWLQECIEELYQELESREIKFKPSCYLADEWLIPDQEPIIGIPFFLAHPALIKLEEKMILDVEGSTHPWCMKLLRHETGHAINYAYKLYRRKKWKKIFGQFSKEYEDTYRFRPYSKSYVKHLEDFYAQYHPDEDFAETFAVWLNQDIDWRKQYKGWKALTKLNYVDELMKEIKSKVPLVKKGKKYWQASRMRTTLRSFYKKKRHHYMEEFPDFHDSNLKRIFALFAEGGDEALSAGSIIKKYKKDILNDVARWTGEKKYIIDELLNKIMRRCKELKLFAAKSETLVVAEVSIYITALVMNYLHTGVFRK